MPIWKFKSGGNAPPNTPLLSYSELKDTSVKLNGSIFSDPNPGDTHKASQWQVDLASADFSSPVVDSGEDTNNLTSYTATGLTAETDYKARCRYEDNNDAWSNWSDVITFTTKETWTGLVMAGTPGDGEKHRLYDQDIVITITDNWYDIDNWTLSIQGTSYTENSNEITVINITNGIKITFTPTDDWDRGEYVNYVCDAWNSNNDHKQINNTFQVRYFPSTKNGEFNFFFKTPTFKDTQLNLIYRHPLIKATGVEFFFRFNGAGFCQLDFFFKYLRQLSGYGQLDSLVCQIKIINTNGSADIAELTFLNGDGSADVRGYFLLEDSGSVDIYGTWNYLGNGSVNITETILKEGLGGSANISYAILQNSSGSYDVYGVYGDVFIRLSIVPEEVRNALAEIGITINE